jgi:hypothetical protein
MQVSLADRKILPGIDGAAAPLSQPPAESSDVDGALRHIEDYVDTVGWGRALTAERDALLPKVISGKRRVRDARRLAAGAV